MTSTNIDVDAEQHVLALSLAHCQLAVRCIEKKGKNEDEDEDERQQQQQSIYIYYMSGIITP